MTFLALAACAPDPCGHAEAWLEDGTEFAALEDAEYAVPDGGVLHICPGTWEGLWYFGPSVESLVEVQDHPEDRPSYRIVGAGIGSTVFEGQGIDGGWPKHLEIADLTMQDGAAGHTEPCEEDFCTGPRYCGGFSVLSGTVLLDHIAIHGDDADYGGAICAGGYDDARWGPQVVELTVRDSFITRNVAPVGSGALLWGPAELISEDTSWGAGDRDNHGSDVAMVTDVEDSPVVAGNWSFDGVASFTCEWDTRTCE